MMGGSGELVACPICGVSIRTSEADEHVDACLNAPLLAFDSPPKETELSKRPKKLIQDEPPSFFSLPAPEPTRTPEASSFALPSAASHSQYGDQVQYLALLKERQKQEEADRLLAKRLQEEFEFEERRTPAVAQVLPVLSATTSSRTPFENRENTEKEARDRILALVLQAEEQDTREARARATIEREKIDREIAAELNRKQQEEERKRLIRDKEIAEELARKQREAERLREESRKFDSAVELIRDEVIALEDEKKLLQTELEKLRKKTEKIDLTVDTVRYPDSWDYMESGESTLDVYQGSAEWNRIQKTFAQTSNKHISRIQRVQNKKLYKWYWLRKEEIKRENGGDANEGWAFHGSRSNAYHTITKDGFDHRLANLSGAYGAGIYFSGQASHSISFASNNKILYCRIAKGAVGPGSSGLRRPPTKANGKLYDSVGSGHITVLFDNNQAYPEYLITFSW